MIGEVLGARYELLEAVGEGGMAIVYKARDRKLNRYVAVKVLKKEFADNLEIAQKFKSEATAIANLSHGNIVNVLDVGHEEDKNTEYFVMEYVSGKTLKELINYNGKLSYQTALTIAMQIAKALEVAHNGNIIHRDVKPQNILVTEAGEVKVTDFGIAKSSTASTITNTTTIMGSAHYLSPEQAKGTFVDIRTDIYSLGIVMYEMVTGRLPFDGDSPVTIALKHIQQEVVSPKKINASIPESVNSLILKAVSKNPVERYQNCKELIIDIQKIKDNPDVVLSYVDNNDDGKTIIMSSVKTNINKVSNNEQSTREKYIKDMYNSGDEDEDGYKKNYKPLIITLIAISILIGAFFIGLKLFEDKPKEVKIPNVINMSFKEAEIQFDELGLILTVGSEVESEKPAGTILEIQPSVDEIVLEGSEVVVKISKEVEKVEVPDLRDYDINYIKELLEQRGLKYEIEEVFHENIEKGILVKQSPEKETKVEKGAIIKLTISKGPEIKLVEIPNLKGYTLEEATAELEKLKLVIDAREQETDRSSEDGIIIDQPSMGNQVEEGTSIVVFYGKYKQPTVDITKYLTVDMLLSDAINTLKFMDIKYKVQGGMPQEDMLDKYKLVSFTEEINEGDTVTLSIEKIPDEPTTGEPSVDGNPSEGGNSGENVTTGAEE